MITEDQLPNPTSKLIQLPWVTPVNYPAILECSGRNRNEFSAFNVSTDSEAISIWLADAGSRSEHTAQSYRREIERFLLWATTVKGKSLSSMFREDFLEFAQFIKKLPSSWIMKKRHQRTSQNWRPFFGQPGASTQVRTLSIINSLMQYLVKSGWLKLNPMPIIKRPKSTIPDPIIRSLSPLDIEHIKASFSDMEVKTPRQKTIKARDEWLFYLYWTTGARASEAALTMNEFVNVSVGGNDVWIWKIVGKGKKIAPIPLPDKTLLRLKEFRRRLRISILPRKDDPIPIIPSLKGMTPEGCLARIPEPLDRRSIDKRLKKIFNRAIEHAEKNGDSTSQLSFASTHWLRHTSIREFYDETGDLKLTQQFARHENINTTAGYSVQSIQTLVEAVKKKG